MENEKLGYFASATIDGLNKQCSSAGELFFSKETLELASKKMEDYTKILHKVDIKPHKNSTQTVDKAKEVW